MTQGLPPSSNTDSQVCDARDLRDPAEVGATLQYLRERNPKGASSNPPFLSSLADDLPRYNIPRTAEHHSATEYTIPLYAQKMLDQAIDGDIHACVVLIQKGWPTTGVGEGLVIRAQQLQNTPQEEDPDAPPHHPTSPAPETP